MAEDPHNKYTHGHHESVLRSHTWRTVENSAKFVIPHVKTATSLLDVGCGPGTITVDFAKNYMPNGKVTGVEYSESVLEKARAHAELEGVKNIEFEYGDIYNLKYPDNSFDVVYAHQVLQHLSNPVLALKELRRVVKTNGVVAVRDSDYETFVWYPEVDGLREWKVQYSDIARSNNAEPNAGRRLFSWALQAGYPKSDITCSSSTWCYSTKEEIAWWSSLWAERTLKSDIATTGLQNGIATREDLERSSKAWREFGLAEDAWFSMIHGEITYRKV
jgi:ubiquinone/menaquinone biosynthesis C-methylase UbiE